jgi:DNA-binding transcriptional ArsR family regulator
MPADLLATIGAEIDARLTQLRAAMDEYEQLLSAAAALEAEERKPKPAREKAAPERKAPVARKASAAAKVAVPPRAAVHKEPAPAKPVRVAVIPKKKAAKTAPSASGAAQQAIMAALEHGSHTVAELAVVTAMSGPTIRESLRALSKARKVTKAKREGKAAYALAS